MQILKMYKLLLKAVIKLQKLKSPKTQVWFKITKYVNFGLDFLCLATFGEVFDQILTLGVYMG